MHVKIIRARIIFAGSDVKERTEKTDKKNAGYCECCGVHFDDFDLVSKNYISYS